MARKITYGLLGLLSLIIVTALLIPFFVDLNSYKDEISQKVKEATGRDLILDGPINLSLLPAPSVTIEHASLSNHPKAQSPTMVSFDKIRVDISFAPLFKKKLQVNNVHLLSPTIRLESFENGENNWTFSPVSEGSKTAAAKTEEESNSDFSFSFDHIEIINADIYYVDGKTEHSLKKLTTRLKISDLNGPFKADGFFKIMGRDVRFDAEVKEIGEKIPLNLELDSMGLEIELKGDFKQGENSFRGDLKIAGDTKSIEKASQKAFEIPSFIGDQLSISGHVSADINGVDIQNLVFKADNENLKGNLSVHLSPLSFKGSLRGLPGQLIFDFSGKPEKKSLTGQGELSLASPKDFFGWLNEEWPKKLVNSRLSMKTSFRKAGEILSFSNLKVHFNTFLLSGSGSFNEAKNTAIYDLKSENLASILSAFIKDIPVKLSSFNVKGQSTYHKKKETVTTRTTLTLPGATASIDGSLSLSQKDLPLFNFKTTLSMTNAEKLLDKPPFKRGNLQAQIIHNSNTISADSLKASLSLGQGSLSLSGAMKVALANKPKITGTFSLAPINASSFLARSGSSPSKKAQVSSTSPSSKASSQSPWSSDPVDLSFLKDFDAKIGLSIPSITFRDHVLKNISTEVSLEKGLLQVPALTGQIYGGKLNVGFSIDAGRTSTVKLRASLDDLSLNRALSKMKDEKIRIVRGELDGLVNMTTNGGSLKSWVENVNGLINLKATKGLVDGFDLQSISRKLKNLNTIDAFLSLFKTAMSSGQTAFSDFSLAIAFKNGIGTISKLVLIADGGEGSGQGTINLPAYRIAAKTEFRLTDHESLPPFEMTLQGPLDSPDKKFDTSALENYLISNVFKKLVGGIATGGPVGAVVSDLLGNITGGSNNDNKPDSRKNQKDPKNQDNDSPVEKVIEAPAKAVENLIKGLF